MTDRAEQYPPDASDAGDNAYMLRHHLTEEINRLHRFATRGLLALALFLGVSMVAWWNFPFLPVPGTVTALLGRPPSARVISIVLLLYTFSALILSLSRMTAGVEHRSSFGHVGYLTVFFLFYYVDTSLGDNYWAVFSAGITILGVESYRIWSYCAEGMAKKREDLEYVTRTGKPPPEE